MAYLDGVVDVGVVDVVDVGVDVVVCVDVGVVDVVDVSIAWPVAGFNRKTNRTRLAMTVINKKGMDIMSHAIMPNSWSHKMFNNKVNTIPIHISIMAVLYSPL